MEAAEILEDFKGRGPLSFVPCLLLQGYATDLGEGRARITRCKHKADYSWPATPPGMGADCSTSSKVKFCNPMGHQSWGSWEKARWEVIRLASDEQVPERKRQVNTDMASCSFCKKRRNRLGINRTQINSLAWRRWGNKSLRGDGDLIPATIELMSP